MSPASNPETELLERESEEAVLDLVRDVLEPDERLAIWLRCFEGFAVDDITRRLDHAPATGARSVLQGARRKLRAALEFRDRQEKRRTR